MVCDFVAIEKSGTLQQIATSYLRQKNTFLIFIFSDVLIIVGKY
jgi:hypothetical protein